MIEQKTNTTATEKYIKANYPDVMDVKQCAEWVKRHEDNFFIDDLICFFMRNQNEW